MHQLFEIKGAMSIASLSVVTVTASACKLISLIDNTPGSQRVSWPSQRCKSSRCCWWLLLIPTAGDEVANPTEGGLQPVTARSRGPEMSTRAPATASRSPATRAATQQPPPGKPRYSISEPCHIFLLTVGPFCRWGGCADPCYPPVTMPHYVFFSPFWEIFCRAICTYARISYLESCPPWVVLPNGPQMRGDHLYATLTTSLLCIKALHTLAIKQFWAQKKMHLCWCFVRFVGAILIMRKQVGWLGTACVYFCSLGQFEICIHDC